MVSKSTIDVKNGVKKHNWRQKMVSNGVKKWCQWCQKAPLMSKNVSKSIICHGVYGNKNGAWCQMVSKKHNWCQIMVSNGVNDVKKHHLSWCLWFKIWCMVSNDVKNDAKWCQMMSKMMSIVCKINWCMLIFYQEKRIIPKCKINKNNVPGW